MQGSHIRSSCDWRRGADDGTFRRIATARGSSGLTADAFVHLPGLRSRVMHPEKSQLRLTPEIFAMWEQRARAAGWPADWRLSDEIIEASRLAMLGDHRTGDDLWIYSYGSLMWDPGFH